MPALAGIVNTDKRQQVNINYIQMMSDSLKHRARDVEHLHFTEGVGLVVRHNQKVGSANTSRPFFSEENHVTVICDNSIINYSELADDLKSLGHVLSTKSDAELIARLYREYGLAGIPRLRGSFALAIWDTTTRKLMLARDRFGVKPLFYANHSGGITFGSSQKSLLANPEITRQMSMKSLVQLFEFGFVFSPATLFASIQQVPPGSFLIFENGCVSIEKYWDYPFHSYKEIKDKKSEREWADLLRAKLEEVVCLYVRNEPASGGWLSGGLDSSAIISLMLKSGLLNVPVTTLHWQHNGFNEIRDQKTLLDFPKYNLQPDFAVCSKDSFAQYPDALWHAETPSTSGLEVPRLLLAEKSAERNNVVLTGEGADEIFGGYPWFRTNKVSYIGGILPYPIRKAISTVPIYQGKFKKIRALLTSSFTNDLNWYRTLLHGPSRLNVSSIFSLSVQESLANMDKQEIPAQLPEFLKEAHPFIRLQYYELSTRLPSLVVFKIDPIAMSRGLDVRIPFLDHELVELAAQIPPGLKLKGFTEKYILRRAVRDLLPPDICRRRKRGLMAPVSLWFREEMPEFAKEMLSEGELRNTGYFEPEAVLRLLNEHQSHKNNWAGILCGVLGVQLWDYMIRRGNGPLRHS